MFALGCTNKQLFSPRNRQTPLQTHDQVLVYSLLQQLSYLLLYLFVTIGCPRANSLYIRRFSFSSSFFSFFFSSLHVFLYSFFPENEFSPSSSFTGSLRIRVFTKQSKLYRIVRQQNCQPPGIRIPERQTDRHHTFVFLQPFVASLSYNG